MSRVNKNEYIDMINICKTNIKGYNQCFKNSLYKDKVASLKLLYPELTSISEILYWIDNDLSDFPKCKVCGKPTKFNNINRGYNIYCGDRCPKLDPEVRDKYKQTCLERYGVDNGFKLDSIKQTNLERYGAENPFASDIIKERIRKTNIERYNAENPMQNSYVQEKAKKTNLERYGATTFIHSKEGKLAVTNIMLEKYGVDHHWKNKDIHQKCFDTIVSKYGGLGNASPIINAKGKQTLYDKTGYKNNWSNPESREKCYNTCLEKYGTKHPVLLHPPIGPSKGQLEVFEFISTFYTDEIKVNDRHLKDSESKIYELDIYLPKISFAIEYDGDYWHSLPDMVERDKNKDALCDRNNIKLFRIKECDWHNNTEIVKNKLKEEICKWI